MKNHKAYNLIYAFLITILVAGCSNNAAVPPLPTSAKYNSNGEITIPFPYTDKLSNGIEQWSIDRDTSNKLVLKVIYKDETIGTFTVNSVGLNNVNGKIKLNGNEYALTTINLNNDSVSGYITIQSK